MTLQGGRRYPDDRDPTRGGRHDVKPRLLGHWGVTPGLNLYAHLSRIVAARSQEVVCVMCSAARRPSRRTLASTYLGRDPIISTSPSTSHPAGVRRFLHTVDMRLVSESTPLVRAGGPAPAVGSFEGEGCRPRRRCGLGTSAAQ
ncbi:hypothetical protein OG767_21565 [Micromonospora sp. NBC_01392]